MRARACQRRQSRVSSACSSARQLCSHGVHARRSPETTPGAVCGLSRACGKSTPSPTIPRARSRRLATLCTLRRASLPAHAVRSRRPYSRPRAPTRLVHSFWHARAHTHASARTHALPLPSWRFRRRVVGLHDTSSATRGASTSSTAPRPLPTACPSRRVRAFLTYPPSCTRMRGQMPAGNWSTCPVSDTCWPIVLYSILMRSSTGF